MNKKFYDLVSNKSFIKKIMELKTLEELKNFLSSEKIEASDEEIKYLISTILKAIENKGKINDDIELENISGGAAVSPTGINVSETMKKVTKGVGQVAAFPFKTAFYTVEAIAAGAPRGFYDGFKDSWNNWEEK